MNRIILFLAGFFLFQITTDAQVSNEKMLFVIDSVSIINTPEPWNEILDEDIADATVIKNKDSLKLLGYGQLDGITYLFTKEYRTRPDSIKRIPSLKQMEMENEVWNFQSKPYTGKYIDYYNSGRKQNEGTLVRGKLNGELKIYYQNGKVASAYNYKEGIPNGISYEYYKNGSLSQKREFKDGRNNGVWETYFPGGQLSHHSKVKNGNLIDSAITYYSTGKVNQTITHNRSKGNIDYLMNEIYKNQQAGDTKSVIEICSKIIKIDGTYTEAYFNKGVAMLAQLRYEEAITQFDEALRIEPLLKHALIYRAMARIRKYGHGNSRTVVKNKELTVVATQEQASMPAEEKEKICTDLMKVDSLQTMYGHSDGNLKFITESLITYCQLDTRR